MWNRLRRWIDNAPLSNPVERRQAGVFQWVLITWIILAAIDLILVYGPSFFLQSASSGSVSIEALPLPVLITFWALTPASLLLLITPASALALLRRGRFQLAVGVATFGLLLSHTAATYALGITNAAVPIVYQIPIALAGLLAGRRLLLSVAGMSIVIFLVVTFLESLSPPLAGFFAIVPNANGEIVSPVTIESAGLTVGFFIGITILMTLLLDRFGGALRDALASSLEREEELQRTRASLETTVAERTAELQTALSDVQARAAEQADLLAQIEQQSTMIRDLSVPVIPINANTLVMPLVGALDSNRLRQLQEQSLQAIERAATRTLVLDITGVPIVDSQVAQGLLTTVRSARLLGAEVVLVGIRPEVAQTIVGLGIDLRDMRTFSDLQSALDQISRRSSSATLATTSRPAGLARATA